MISGIGFDIVEVERIRNVLQHRRDRFLKRVFADHEVIYAMRKRKPEIHLAAGFAAKEAFLKAIGVGLGRGVSMNEVAVVHEASGKSSLTLIGEANVVVQRLKIGRIYLSLSHTEQYATAIVILET
ncbi:MAG: holo-ACP synthase [Syntrophales bacterium]|jgi:holo-[acyl-carrier protein] synthase